MPFTTVSTSNTNGPYTPGAVNRAMATASPTIKRAVNSFKKRDLIVTPKLEEFLRSERGDVFPEPIAEYVKQGLMKADRDRAGGFSPSQLGVCPRRQVFRFLGFPEMASSDTRANLVMSGGTWHHLKWQATLLHLQVLSQTEAFFADTKLRFSGSMDGIGTEDDGDAYGFELKTINRYGFAEVSDDGPRADHILQIRGYSVLTDLRRYSLVYEDRDTMDYKEYVIEVTDHDVADTRARIDTLNNWINISRFPPQLNGCKRQEGTEFKQCPYRDICGGAQWPAAIPAFQPSGFVPVELTAKPPKRSRAVKRIRTDRPPPGSVPLRGRRKQVAD